MEKSEKKYLFESAPIWHAVIALALPTVVGQIVTVIYNMADTFFIGKLNDPVSVAAVQVSMPLFIFFNAIANLFSVGGSSLISRALGEGNFERARRTSSFCIWSAATLAMIYGAAVCFMRPVLLPMLGASDESIGYCYNYVFWTISVGAVPTVMNNVLSQMIRAEGYSKEASLGVAAGGVLNMILDPLFIFGLNLRVTGAAAATLISNVAASAYFVFFILKKRDVIATSLNVRYYTVSLGIPAEVLTVGLPSSVISMMATLSNAELNRLVASYSDKVIAGMGIAKKINLLTFAMAQGMTQGAMPLIGYNYASGNKRRMSGAIKTTLLFSFTVSVAGAVFLFFFAPYVAGVFISDAETVDYGIHFLKIFAFACITTPLNFLVITVFQATGCRVRPLILSMLRKGAFDIPLMLIFNHCYGMFGIALATPVADAAALVVSAAVLIPYLRKLGNGDAAVTSPQG